MAHRAHVPMSTTARLPRRTLLQLAASGGLVLAGGAGRWRSLVRPGSVAAQTSTPTGADDTLLTYKYSNMRWGWRAAPITVSGLHLQGQLDLGSSVRAQPLYAPGYVPINGPAAGQSINLLLVGVSDDTVAAYDADALFAGSTTPLWSTSLGQPTNRTGGYLYPEGGIQGTPIIDLEQRVVYIMALLKDDTGTFEEPHAYYAFHVIDLDTGTVLSATNLDTDATGTADPFVGNDENNRSALTLVGGRIYATFSDFLEASFGPYHGWIVSHDQQDPTQQRYWCATTTPGLKGAGIWGQGGVTADAAGNLFVATSGLDVDFPDYFNALLPPTVPPDWGDYFQAFLRLQPTANGLQVVDWFMPSSYHYESSSDLDLGCSSPILLPTINGRDLAVLAGKTGVIYLFDRNHLGGIDGALATYPTFTPDVYGGSRSAPAFMLAPNGDPLVFVCGVGSPSLVCLKVATQNGGPVLQPVWDASQSIQPLGSSAGAPYLTGSGTDATVWIVDNGYDTSNGADNHIERLYGFNALTGALVYDSNAVADDALGKTAHFPTLTPIGDRLLAATWTGLSWYGAA